MAYHKDLTHEEITVMKQFTSFIAEFTKHGQPTHGDPNKKYPQFWKKFQPGRGEYILIENPPKLSRNAPFPSKRLNFWMKDIFQHPEDLMSDFHEPAHLRDEL